MIWIAAGTEEGRRIAKALAKKNREIMVSVTTEYGGALIQKDLQNIGTNRRVIVDSALDYEEMQKILQEFPIAEIVDATHPYADVVSKNLIALAEENNLSYLRYERPSLRELLQEEGLKQEGLQQVGEQQELSQQKLLSKDPFQKQIGNKILWVKNTEEAIEALKKSEGRVLLTTGSKTLGDYLNALDISRIYARVLPVPTVMEKCKALGLPPGQILGMQGPFSTDFNKSTLLEYNIESMITKDSGLTGGVQEKILGALETKVKIIIIERPNISYPRVFNDIEFMLEQL